MKKMIIVLAVLLIAAPAMALVTINCAQDSAVDGTGKVTVSFSNDAAPALLVRAFALDLTVSAGGACTAASLSSDYWVHPGSIVIDGAGAVTDYGTPVAAGAGTLTLTTEQGSLYIGTPPVQSGSLVQLVVKNNCNVSVGLNAIRGGIIMEDGSAPATSLNGCAVVAMCTTCKGDIGPGPGYGAGDGTIRVGDIGNLIGMLNASGTTRIRPGDALWNPCGDIGVGPDYGTGDGTIRVGDIGNLIGKLNASGSTRIQCAGQCP